MGQRTRIPMLAECFAAVSLARGETQQLVAASKSSLRGTDAALHRSQAAIRGSESRLQKDLPVSTAQIRATDELLAHARHVLLRGRELQLRAVWLQAHIRALLRRLAG